MKAKDYIIIGGAVALFLLWKNKNKKVGTSTTTGGGGGELPLTPSNEPEQVFLGLPTGMDLPVLTAGTGVPTEVAVQQGGVRTNPTPALVGQPAFEIEESLSLGGIKPLVKPFKPYLPVYETTELPSGMNTIIDPIIIVPRENPKLYLADQ